MHSRAPAEHEARGEAQRRARKVRPEYTTGDLARVASARHQAEAELLQNLLLEEGVPSMLRRTAGFDVPDFLAAGPRDVLVPESGLEAARQALSERELERLVARPAALPRRPLRLAAAILGGGLLSALVAWGLLQAGP